MRIYTQNEHNFFDQLVTFLGALTSFFLGVEAQARGQTKGFSPERYIVLSGNSKVTNTQLQFFPHELLKYFVNQQWPDTLKLHVISTESEQDTNSDDSFKVPRVDKFTNYLIMYTFIHYFESARLTIESRYGNDCQNWPSEWNFGRVVRNAFAHGGIIKIDNPSAPPVYWNTLSYSLQDNGRQIVPEDITAVEMIILMEEMDSFLR